VNWTVHGSPDQYDFGRRVMLVEICGVHKNPIKIVLSMAIYMRATND